MYVVSRMCSGSPRALVDPRRYCRLFKRSGKPVFAIFENKTKKKLRRISRNSRRIDKAGWMISISGWKARYPNAETVTSFKRRYWTLNGNNIARNENRVIKTGKTIEPNGGAKNPHHPYNTRRVLRFGRKYRVLVYRRHIIIIIIIIIIRR